MKVRFLGETSEESLKRRVKNVAGAGKLSHFDGSVFEVIASSEGYEEDLKVINRITRSGHKSIIEHDSIQIGISNVTPIIEQILIGFRLTAFTIKSRRYVDFRNAGYYIPSFRNTNYEIHMNNNSLIQKYKTHQDYLFSEYSAMIDAGIPKEDARFLMPYSFFSNIFMTVNSREFEKMIIYLLYSKDSKIQEVHDLGEEFLNIARQYVPYIVSNIEKYNPNSLTNNYEDAFNIESSLEVMDKPVLIDYTDDPDNVILKTAIVGEAQCSYDEADIIIAEAEKKDHQFKEKYIDYIIKKPENRELEYVDFTWQIPISLSILTHLTRHRMHSLITPNFVPLWNFDNYIIPDSIKNSEFLERYKEAVKENIKIVNEFREVGVTEEDLVYFYLGCQMCNVITRINGRELTWFTRMRACNRAQWQIRDIAKYMIEETSKIAPLFSKGLGPTCVIYHFCPEGKRSCGLIKKILAEKSL